MNRRKFIGTCTYCAFASMGAMLLNKDNFINKSDNLAENIITQHVEIHITEHCNLNCKYCCHFSTIAEKEFYDLDKFKQDMKQMSSVFNKHLLDIQLLGGEPLLNPQINEYIKTSRKYFPETRISIITNATLLDDMDENFWKTLNENNADIVPSIYPVEINWKSILDKAQKYNIGVYGNFRHQEKLTLDNIDKFRKNYFFKMAMNINGYKDTGKNYGCGSIDKPKTKKLYRFSSMYDGKLYPCATIAYIRHLNKKFNTNFTVTKDDYIDLYKARDVKEIISFLEKPQQFPFCNYCMLNSKKVKWENSPIHDINEWT